MSTGLLPWSRRRGRAGLPGWSNGLLLTVIYSGVFVSFLVLKPWSPPVVAVIDDVASVCGQLLGAAFAVGAWWRPVGLSSAMGNVGTHQHRAPVLVGLGILCFTLGSAVWSVYELILRQPPFPSLADPLFLAAYPFLLWGILLLPLRSLTAITRTRIILDSTMVMAAVVTFSWYYVLGPTLQGGAQTLLASVVGAAYPLADLLLFFCILILWSRAADAALRPVVVFLLAGLGTIVVADSLFAYAGLHGGFATGGLIDPLWPLGFMLLGLGAGTLRRALRDARGAASPAAAVGAFGPSLWRTLLPYAFLPAVGVLVLATVRGNDAFLDAGVYIGGGVLIGLVVLRQVLALAENQRLYREVAAQHAAVADANAHLEQHVVERTAQLEDAVVALRAQVEERRRAEERAQRARAGAEAANQAKSEFLSRMSHELRTPLNAILGFGQVLEMRDLGPRGDEGVGQILTAGRHLLQLVDDVLAISRIDEGRVTLTLEPVDVLRSVRKVLALSGPLAAPRGIQIVDEVAPAAAPQPGGWTLLADHQRLTQILLTLVDNAITYGRDGGQVTVAGVEQAGGRLRLLVRDSGMGLRPEEMARLFVPFERLDAEHRGIGGTGIGLALAKRLVEAMGGTIGVESVVGEGSTFWVELPLAMGEATRQSLGPSASDTAVGPVGSTQQRTVLYIQNGPSTGTLIAHLLRKVAEVRLLTAPQGRLAVELAREHTPDLILLDVDLPDMLGDEVLRRLQADPQTRDIPVVLLSADAVPSQIARLREAGAAAYLTKPLDVQQFLQTVQDFLTDGKR